MKKGKDDPQPGDPLRARHYLHAMIKKYGKRITVAASELGDLDVLRRIGQEDTECQLRRKKVESKIKRNLLLFKHWRNKLALLPNFCPDCEGTGVIKHKRCLCIVPPFQLPALPEELTRYLVA
ncbi:MAG: hypothetical protein KW806_00810 [Candidatus Yanofskybacteria bacterium]|nr:hypothetical protein [Candidatus Yanofskybacteria bacterium]